MFRIELKNMKTIMVTFIVTGMLMVTYPTIGLGENSSLSSCNSVVSRLQQKQTSLSAFREDADKIQTSTLARRPIFAKHSCVQKEEKQEKPKDRIE